MPFRINGIETEVGGNLTIGRLLSERNIVPNIVVIQYNGKILRKELFDTTQIIDGDNIEILRFVGGG
ncbi:MAG: sulfur carrier protein ThiS [Chitinispirillales bacterium]|jgi:sulfur carrier protein|nr:sulfur carrier protein ThiS [Chitinispirillales bacterium]